MWRRVQKRNSGFCLPFCLEESCLPAFVWITDTSAPLLMPLVPFKLLLQCWSSEGVIPSKSVCGLFKRNCLGLQKFLPPTQSLLGPGRPGVGLGLLAPKIISPKFLTTKCGCGTSLFHVSTPPTSLDECGCFNFVVVRLSFHSISDHSE